MRVKTVIFLILVIFLSLQDSYAQVQGKLGGIRGVVLDSVTSAPIPSVTGTVYAGKDSTIIKYLFTSNTGSFDFKDLPVGTPLTVSLSFIGYRTFTKKISLSQDASLFDMGEIRLPQRNNILDEVVITGQRPPIVMRNDTLEINAEAFKTKENAVVEDLLKKVPGVVVWADGKITVNGKPVRQLLVEGKPFFGGDPVVAIRNLPKDAINKIKVYRETANPDSVNVNTGMVMDISLKNDKKSGYFGKIGGGAGTDKRYEASGALNRFSPKNQTSIFAVGNNVNKEAYDVGSMLRQSVYRPGGSDNSGYQSNFFKNGLNRFRAAGFNFSRDWKKDISLRSEYFTYLSGNETEKNLQSAIALNSGYLNQQSMETSNNTLLNHKFYGSLDKINSTYEYHITPVFEWNKTSSGSQSSLLTTGEDGRLLNKNEIGSEDWNNKKRLSLDLDYRKKSMVSDGLKAKYNIDFTQYEQEGIYKTGFSAFGVDGTVEEIKSFNRRSASHGYFLNQSLGNEFSIPRLVGFLRIFNPLLTNTATLLNQKDTREVNNFDPAANAYSSRNNYLSNSADYQLLQERPGIRFSGTKFREMPNRYYRSLSYTVALEGQFLAQRNNSDKSFQNLKRNYSSFLPSFNLRYNHRRQDAFERTVSLNYSTAIELPSIAQLVPLIDSINQNYLALGNPRLTKQYKHEMRVSFTGTRTNNGGTLNVNLSAGVYANKFADSSFYDNAGRRISYTVNVGGFKYTALDMNYIRSAKLFNKPLGLFFYNVVNYSVSPYYLNGEMNTSNNLYATVLGKSNFVFNDLFQFDLDGSVTYYRNTYKGASSGNYQRLLSTALNPSLQIMWPKRVTLVNSLLYNVDNSSYAEKITSAIWNLSIYYRMLKKETLELKFTANDLLRQRTNVISYVNNNTVSLGRSNNLQQFFLISMSYFPRHFGIKKTAKTDKP